MKSQSKSKGSGGMKSLNARSEIGVEGKVSRRRSTTTTKTKAKLRTKKVDFTL